MHRELALGLVLFCSIAASALEDRAGAPSLDLIEQALLEDRIAAVDSALLRLLAEAPEPVVEIEEVGRGLARTGHGDRFFSLLLRLAEDRIRSGDYTGAERLAEAAARLEPGTPDPLVLVGRARALARRYLAAEEPLRAAVEMGRRDLKTLLYLGSTLWENGRLEAAEEILRRAVAAGRSAAALHQLGRLLLWQGRYVEAAELLDEAARKNAGRVDVALDLAQALAGEGRLEEAELTYRRVIEVSPRDSQARYGLARVLLRLGQTEAAARQLAAYQALYEEEQEGTRLLGLQEARVERAYDHLQAGRTEAAIQLLQALPESPEALVALGLAYRAAGQREAAIAALERAVTLAPDREDLRSLLNETRLSRDQP